MTAQELKQMAWEMDATASALAANLEIMRQHGECLVSRWARVRAKGEAASLQAYAHALQAEAAKEGAA